MNEPTLRARVVALMADEIGPGDTDAYWRAVGIGPPYPKRNTPTGHWCGAMALWAIKGAFAEFGYTLPVNWKIGLGFCEVGPMRLPRTKAPKPGDVAYSDQPFQHHAVVEKLEGGVLTTIDGNQPDVRRKTRKEPAGIVYYSIAPYIAAAGALPMAPGVPPAWRDIHPGMRGEYVRAWQISLLRWRPDCLPRYGADGAYGTSLSSETLLATKAFQSARGLPDTGVVDQATWDAGSAEL